MTAYVDTSAFLALANADDEGHSRCEAVWRDLLGQDIQLVCTNYVLVETVSLLQSRMGMAAVRDFCEDVRPLFTVEWITEEVHERSLSALLVAGRRRLSLVDCASFETMRRLGLNQAFTLDAHFREQGFETLP